MVTSPYEWKILELEINPNQTKKTPKIVAYVPNLINQIQQNKMEADKVVRLIQSRKI